MSGAPTDVLVESVGSTTIHSLPSANPAGVSDTVALPVQGVTSGVPIAVSLASAPLPTGAAGDGTDGTSITQPPGGSGIRGWLSGIYNKLASSVAVTGTFWPATQAISGTVAANATQTGTWTVQPGNTANTTAWKVDGSTVTQPISVASLPLPTGASTAANQIGRTVMPIVTPVVTSNGAYSAGDELGGLMTFAVGGAGTGTLMSARVTSRSILTTALKLYIFTTQPTNTTWTNKTQPAIVAGDNIFLLCEIPLTTPGSGLGTHTIWGAGGLGMQFIAANLYGVLVLVSSATLTSTSASDITVELGVAVD